MPSTHVLFERAGEVLEPTEHAVGPWADGRLHGGAVAGLLAELVAPAERGQSVAAFRVELFGPVPREPLHSRVTCVRPGARLSIWDVSLGSADRTHARATALLAASAEGCPDATRPMVAHGPEDGAAPSRRVSTSSPFFEGIDFRVVQGAIGAAGPATLWTKVSHRWLRDQPPSGLARLAAVADVAYGYGLPVDGNDWLAMNLDVSLHLLREPRGEWIMLDASTEIAPTGIGVGHADIADQTGRLGKVTQSIVVSAARP